MDWIEIVVHTTTSGSDSVSSLMIELGATGTMTEDRADIPDPAKPHGIWEIIDPKLLSSMPEDVLVHSWFELGDQFPGIFSKLHEQLANLKFQYPGYGSLQIETRSIPDENWAESWKRFYRPLRAGKHLIIKPSWENVDTRPGDHIIQLDPGMAFGTGTHPTTALCLEYLDSIDLKGKQVLDYGCGSGILAISALKLGAENALGIDIEEQAIIASKENATRNCVAERLELFMDPKEMEDKPLSPVTVANILAGPLSMLEPAIASLTAKGGLLALSGILTEQADEVLKTYEKDFDMNPIKELNGWALLTGVRK